MKLLVFGGCYSNLEATKALKQWADANGFKPNEVICTGDVIGYCANPEETAQLVKNWGVHCIAGNVELQLAENADDCGCDFSEGSRCDVFSQQWYPFANASISEEIRAWCQQLPHFLRLDWNGLNIGVVHGSIFNVSEFIFKSTPWQVKQRNFEHLKVDVILSGHSGLPFTHQNEQHHWINSGALGMPANNASTKVWFVTLRQTDAGNIEIEHHQLAYDHQLAAEKMRLKHLPEAYAKTLETGIWDNTEILPPEETSNSGLPIEI